MSAKCLIKIFLVFCGCSFWSLGGKTIDFKDMKSVHLFIRWHMNWGRGVNQEIIFNLILYSSPNSEVVPDMMEDTQGFCCSLSYTVHMLQISQNPSFQILNFISLPSSNSSLVPCLHVLMSITPATVQLTEMTLSRQKQMLSGFTRGEAKAPGGTMKR